jgi:ribonuclease G
MPPSNDTPSDSTSSDDTPAEPAPTEEAPAPSGDGEPATPAESASTFVEKVEGWIADHKDRHRAVTLRVHPFTAAFLRRPVPSYPTRWFMDHLVRVHLEEDEEVPPLHFRAEHPHSGDALSETS